ncbi:MAG: SMC-Scp complex subunit ScpB, partial [Solirubrobacterales bacterium]|nr:SMC-Scp complex subunit ScpB [Solirubrobacterales bacterium]
MSELARVLEALLFLSPDPVSPAELAEAAECDIDDVEAAVAELDAAYAPGARGLQLKRVAGGVALATDPVAE